MLYFFDERSSQTCVLCLCRINTVDTDAQNWLIPCLFAEGNGGHITVVCEQVGSASPQSSQQLDEKRDSDKGWENGFATKNCGPTSPFSSSFFSFWSRQRRIKIPSFAQAEKPDTLNKLGRSSRETLIQYLQAELAS